MSDALQKVTREKQTPIIPEVPAYYNTPGPSSLDYKAICCFVAAGFFLEDDTYFTNRKAFLPATNYRFDELGNVIGKVRSFEWSYAPRDMAFSQASDEFSNLLEKIVTLGTQNKRIILPISGGLDSRTLAVALMGRKDVHAYSYEFENGVRENAYGKSIAASCGYPFEGFTIARGYLWKTVQQAAKINGCYADLINPRQ